MSTLGLLAASLIALQPGLTPEGARALALVEKEAERAAELAAEIRTLAETSVEAGTPVGYPTLLSREVELKRSMENLQLLIAEARRVVEAEPTEQP